MEEELKTVGRKNPANPADWEAIPAKMEVLASDENEVADTIEEFENNSAILKQLEIRYNEVKSAIERIEKGTFGVCRICDKPIEKERLNANPAAETCEEHMNQ